MTDRNLPLLRLLTKLSNHYQFRFASTSVRLRVEATSCERDQLAAVIRQLALHNESPNNIHQPLSRPPPAKGLSVI